MSREAAGTTVTLRALSGRPLDEPSVHDMVVATARAIAERHGVEVTSLRTGPDHITVTLDLGQLEAVGYAAELRRLTGRWFADKHGGVLWGEAG